VGEYLAGKTAIITRYTENNFCEDYIPTMLDFKIKKIEQDNLIVKL
jgi:hypothetical protein